MLRTAPSGVCYAEVDEVEDADGKWNRAPTPPPPVADDEYDGDAFVAHHRQAASGNMLETTTWVELCCPGLVLALRKRFPHDNRLHDREPGVSSPTVDGVGAYWRVLMRHAQIDSRQLYQERAVLEDDCSNLMGYTQDAMRALLDFIDARYAKVYVALPVHSSLELTYLQRGEAQGAPR